MSRLSRPYPLERTESDAISCQQPATRTYDRRRGLYAVRVLPGGAYVTRRTDEMIVTVLGSCVAACIRDPASGFGGLNHFMLPESESGTWNGVSAAMRYGNHAMEVLINEVLKSGCRRQDLEIKLFGGADLTDGPSLIGSSNVAFVLDYLAAHEVAHLKEMNHSHRFWTLTHKLCPRTEEAEAWLKRHGAGLHGFG